MGRVILFFECSLKKFPTYYSNFCLALPCPKRNGKALRFLLGRFIYFPLRSIMIETLTYNFCIFSYSDDTSTLDSCDEQSVQDSTTEPESNQPVLNLSSSCCLFCKKKRKKQQQLKLTDYDSRETVLAIRRDATIQQDTSLLD